MVSAGDGIRCLLCGSDTSVMETRQNRGSLRRRRRCLRDGCLGRLTTVEVMVPQYSKKVITSELVAMPSHDAEHMEVVPRHLMQALRDLLQVMDVDASAPEEHW
jgi:transcriptional regulator NrdR family protein